jgi:hypothetical protein
VTTQLAINGAVISGSSRLDVGGWTDMATMLNPVSYS